MSSQAAIGTTAGRVRLFDSILDTVGDTLAILINNLGIEVRTIRLGLNMIDEPERTGALSKSRDRSWSRRPATMQGIGLAKVCAQGPCADRDDAIHETTIEERESTIAPARGSTGS
jgi:cysteine synthase A